MQIALIQDYLRDLFIWRDEMIIKCEQLTLVAEPQNSYDESSLARCRILFPSFALPAVIFCDHAIASLHP